MHSSLISLPAVPAEFTNFIQVGSPSPTEVILHLAPGVSAPEGAVVLMSGEAPWTWGQFAKQYPQYTGAVTPQEWLGEATAIDLVPGMFAQLDALTENILLL